MSGTFVRENHPALLRILQINLLRYSYGAITLYGVTFQESSPSFVRSYEVHTPHFRRIVSLGFGLTYSAFARRYSRNHYCFLFLPILKCFTSRGSSSLMGILRIIGPQVDVLFEDLGVNVCVRLTRAFRSLPRSSSVPKPRYPPNSGGVMAPTEGKVQTEPEPRVLFQHHTLVLLRTAG